jgi:hypothetical protein
MIPVFGTPRNVAIPATAQGSFSVQLPFPKDQRILFTMSDSTGFGSGGTTDIQTVGPSVGGKTCNTVDPGVAFPFQLNSVLQQCRPYTFSDYSGAIQPVTIMGLIPGGQSVVMKPPVGSTTFDWVANVEAGTSMIFVMIDSQGRQGGSSDVKTIGGTGDRTCLSGSSPSSTSSLTSTSTPTSTSTSSHVSRPTSAAPTRSATSTSSPQAQTSHAAGMSHGVVAGIAVGSLVAVAALVSLGVFFRRSRNRPYGMERSHRHLQRLQSHENLHYQPHGQGSNPFSYSYPAPMINSPSSATHFMTLSPNLTDPTNPYMQSPSHAPSDTDSNMRSPQPSLPFNVDPSSRLSPQQSVPHDANAFMLPPAPQASYNANANNMQPSPQQALGPQAAWPRVQLPAQQASYDAGPNMQSPPSQPPPSFNADPSIPQQSSISQKDNPFLQRSPSPSLLPYDDDSCELPRTSLPPSQALPTSGFSQIRVADDSVTSIAPQKAVEAGEASYKPTRFVVHTDVVEPPQYSDYESSVPQSPQAHQQQPHHG